MRVHIALRKGVHRLFMYHTYILAISCAGQRMWYVCIYICILCHTYMYICTFELHIRIYVHIYVNDSEGWDSKIDDI